MRETDFINQNKDKWSELEKLFREETKDPDKLSNLFVQVTDDLSYSRTFYPNRSVRVYLNNIAQQLFYSIYKNKKESKNYFVAFWKEELPQLIYEARKELMFSLIVFVIAVVIGITSSANDASFARVILGDNYVTMTMENIKTGDPMAVYKKMNGVNMFLGITLNNLFVAFRTFVLGVFYMIGTIAMLMYNGIMVGVFQYFFYQRGLFVTSFLSIWLHGTLEISSLIIGAGAGITMGKGLVFPGTYSRIQSFVLSAQRGFKILCGIIPILVLAAIIESFMTRYTDAPAALKLIIILFSLTFILGYFIWYPWKKHKQGFKTNIGEARLIGTPDVVIDTHSIRSNGELLKDVFGFYRKSIGRLFRPFLIISLGATVVTGIVHHFTTSLGYEYKNWFFAFQLFNYHKYYWFQPINTLMLSISIWFVLNSLKRQLLTAAGHSKGNIAASFRRFMKVFVITFLFNAILFWSQTFFAVVLFLLFMPVMLMWIFITFYFGDDIFESFGDALSIINTSIRQVLGLSFMMILLSLIFFLMIDSPLLYVYFEIINWNLNVDPHLVNEIILLLMVFTSFIMINLIMPILVSGIGFVFFSLTEMKNATSLKERIRTLAVAE